MNNLISYLFETKAVKACEANKPFWLTSGKIGVYFINGEFLYGNEQDSKQLLEIIDQELLNCETLPSKIFHIVWQQYETNTIFQYVINEMKECVIKNINIDEIDYIAGGERRDWIFSFVLAKLLNKPHITIFKDSSVLENDSNFTNIRDKKNIHGKNILHVSDLITEAASYTSIWIPALEKLGAKMKWTITVIDRMQGGSENLSKAGVLTYSMVKVTKDLFKTALEKGMITNSQFEMIDEYINNPDETMREFLVNHPEFIEESLKGAGKTLIRVQKCIEEDLYNLS